MKVLYIDLETTGLNWEYDQIVEIGMLLDDLVAPVEDLPRKRIVIKRDRYIGQPVALAMHNELLAQIGMNDPELEPFICIEHGVAGIMHAWLSEFWGPDGRITVGGKNVAGFDINFLGKLPNFYREGSKLSFGRFQFRQRVVDPAILYYKHGIDNELPNTNECCRRAGLARGTDHTALGDCELVCRLVRYALDCGVFK